MTNPFDRYFMEKNRLETLVDGIFAIVMTLLVMTVVVPQRETVLQSTGFMEMVRSKIHDIVNYALSFALLAIFWMQHHEQAHFIKRTDATHIWINVLTLFFVALFPFSTSLVTEFPDQNFAEIVFGTNLFAVGVLFLSNWLYATNKRRLVDEAISHSDIVLGRNKCIFFICIALISIALSQVPLLSSDVFWVVPLLVISGHLFKKKPQKA